MVLVFLYIDDIIIIVDAAAKITHLKAFLHQGFDMNDLGPIWVFFSVELRHNPDGFHLTHHKYVMDLLHHFNMHACKPFSISTMLNTKLSTEAGVSLEDLAFYKSMVGALKYLTLTILDITYTINQVC